jgi:hypothetical protein
MKRISGTGLLISALMIAGLAITPKHPAQTQGKELAVVEITDKLQLQDKILQGTYIFEHDDERMARGEPCMYIYTSNKGKPGERVAAFHCTPVQRELAKAVVISVAMTSDPEVWKLKEIQFAGSTKGHLVP